MRKNKKERQGIKKQDEIKNERSDTRHLFSFHIIILLLPSIGQTPERTIVWQTMN
jgi:hypothetical protein